MITNVRKLFPVLIAAVLAFGGCTAPAGPARTVEDFNFGWRFALGDNPERALPEFDDSGWRELHLPHDWSIEGDFSKDNPATPNGGALPGGTGWYRKHFTTPDSERVHVEFDGVYMNSTVYVNGKEAGTRPFGYASFSYDITPLLNPAGADNVMAVRCDNSLQPNSRWYTGSGIYRNAPLWRYVRLFRERFPQLPVYCDPSHIGGKRELISPLCQQAMDMNFDGLIIESHNCPDKAWSDASQQITPDILEYILNTLVIRDTKQSTENLTELRSQIDLIDNDLLDLISKRMRVSREIGTYKKEHNMPVLQSARYDEIMQKRVILGNSLGMSTEFMQTMWEAIHEESVRQQIEIINS